MSCILRASGPLFDVDEFLRYSPFAPTKVFHKGELRSPHPSSKTAETSGSNLVVSPAGFDDLPRQIADAMEFLNQHKQELSRLATFPGVEGVTLDFGIPRREVVAQFDRFPPRLLALAGSLGVGIELSHYPLSDG
jgi:hypothetical protein